VKDLMRLVHLINDNYFFMESHKEAVERDLNLPYRETLEYFHVANDRANEYIRYALRYLRNCGCVEYEEVLIVESLKFETDIEGGDIYVGNVSSKTRHRATDSEKKLFVSLKEQAIKEADIHKASEMWVGKKAKVFYSTLQNLLEENDLNMVIQGFELWRVDMGSCMDVLKTYPSSKHQREENMGACYKVILDRNAAKRAEKNQRDPSYTKHFEQLSEITLLYNASDIRSQMPSAYKSKHYKFRIHPK